MAKLYATEAAVTATREATQIFGGYGFMDETPGRPLLPRRQDPRDRRGHERDPAPRDQPRARPARSDASTGAGGCRRPGRPSRCYRPLPMSDGPRRPRRRRTWPQRLLIALNVVVVLICFASAAGLAYVVPPGRATCQRFGGLRQHARHQPSTGRARRTILLVGVDNVRGPRQQATRC